MIYVKMSIIRDDMIKRRKLSNKEALMSFSLIRLVFQNIPRLALQLFAYFIYDFQ